ncbi:MAG: hypothetical protein WC107_03830 [Patescibacteria group bacterium]
MKSLASTEQKPQAVIAERTAQTSHTTLEVTWVCPQCNRKIITLAFPGDLELEADCSCGHSVAIRV